MGVASEEVDQFMLGGNHHHMIEQLEGLVVLFEASMGVSLIGVIIHRNRWKL